MHLEHTFSHPRNYRPRHEVFLTQAVMGRHCIFSSLIVCCCHSGVQVLSHLVHQFPSRPASSSLPFYLTSKNKMFHLIFFDDVSSKPLHSSLYLSCKNFFFLLILLSNSSLLILLPMEFLTFFYRTKFLQLLASVAFFILNWPCLTSIWK